VRGIIQTRQSEDWGEGVPFRGGWGARTNPYMEVYRTGGGSGRLKGKAGAQLHLGSFEKMEKSSHGRRVSKAKARQESQMGQLGMSGKRKVCFYRYAWDRAHLHIKLKPIIEGQMSGPIRRNFTCGVPRHI